MSSFSFTADTANATTAIVFTNPPGEAIYEWDIPWTRMVCDFRMEEKANMCFEVEHQFEGTEMSICQVFTVLGNTSGNTGSNLFGLDGFPPLLIRSNLNSGNFSSKGYCDVMGMAYVPEILIGNNVATVATVPVNVQNPPWGVMAGKYTSRKNTFRSNNLTTLLRLQIRVTSSSTTATGATIGVNGFSAKGLHRFTFTEIPV